MRGIVVTRLINGIEVSRAELKECKLTDNQKAKEIVDRVLARVDAPLPQETFGDQRM